MQTSTGLEVTRNRGTRPLKRTRGSKELSRGTARTTLQHTADPSDTSTNEMMFNYYNIQRDFDITLIAITFILNLSYSLKLLNEIFTIPLIITLIQTLSKTCLKIAIHLTVLT